MLDGPLAELAPGPLAGLRIIDLTHMLAGPYATMLLADLGADVIKVESLTGDFIRGAGPLKGVAGEKFGGYFHSVNRNKESISLDLSTESGKAVLIRLVESADAIVENFRVGVMDKMGLGYETLHEANPALVYACIRGFGDPRSGESPYVDWPAYDIVGQAMGGFMSITGYDSMEPLKAGPGIGDIFPAVLLDVGLLAAIMNARATGRGQFVDVAMYDAVLSLSERIVYQHSISGEVPGPIGNSHPLFAPFGVYASRDGWLTIAAPSDREWQTLAPLMGRPDLATDERYARSPKRVRNREQVKQIVADWVATMTTAEVVAILGGRVPVGPIQSIDKIAADPHVAVRDMIVEVEHPGTDGTVKIAGTPIKFSETPAGVRSRAPVLGEHTDKILTDSGFSPQEIAGLRADGIVR